MTKQLVIDGELRPGARVLEVDEPALGRPFESVSVAGVDDLNAAVASAAAAFPAWSSLGLEAFDHYTEWRNIWIDTDAQVARSAQVRGAR
jgi:acyl-CoA reductase-like NAD-dependent aldehyde dehydrogenase